MIPIKLFCPSKTIGQAAQNCRPISKGKNIPGIKLTDKRPKREKCLDLLKKIAVPK